jgi:putative restriction endonuclease
MAERIFGHVAGYPEGSLFEDRVELHAAGVHRHLQAGIAGSQTEGAESIVLSGGYEDDEDFGDTIIYTGYGGRDSETGQQTHDQPFTRWNRALAYSGQNGLPVRVIRGSSHDSPYSPATGYSYDGLYTVEDFWHDIGTSGFKIWRFRLTKIPEKVVPGQRVAEEPADYSAAERQEVRVSRIVRDTAQSRRSKPSTITDARCAEYVWNVRRDHMRRLPIFGHLAHRTMVRTLRTTSCACARTIMYSLTTAPSPLRRIYP